MLPAIGSTAGGIISAQPLTPYNDLQVIIVPTPRTELLRQEAAALIRQAIDLEARTVQDRGYIPDAGSVDELLAQVRNVAPMTIAPTLASVAAWAAETVAALQERIARLPGEDQRQRSRIVLTLTWAEGAIDQPRSRGRVEGLDG